MIYSNKPVQIYFMEFEDATTVDISLESDIAVYPVEAEVDINVVSTSITRKPKSFNVRLNLMFKDGDTEKRYFGSRWDRQAKYEFLHRIWHLKTLFKFICDFGSFDNMVIKNLSVRESEESANVYEAELELQEIILVSYIPATFQYILDTNGYVTGASTITKKGVDITLTKPKDSTKKKNRDIFEQAFVYVHDTRPGMVIPKSKLEEQWREAI